MKYCEILRLGILVCAVSLCTAADPTATLVWYTGFESAFPSADSGIPWYKDFGPRTKNENGWDIVGTEDGVDPYSGERMYKGWINGAAESSHRPYPIVNFNSKNPADTLRDYYVNTWYIWHSVDWASQDNWDWVHFLTLCHYDHLSWWIPFTICETKKSGTPEIEFSHVKGQTPVNGKRPMPQRQWVRFTVYVNAVGDSALLWLDGELILKAWGGDIKNHGDALMHAHWGMYAGAKINNGVQYNDEISLYQLSGPWNDFSREPLFVPPTTKIADNHLPLLRERAQHNKQPFEHLLCRTSTGPQQILISKQVPGEMKAYSVLGRSVNSKLFEKAGYPFFPPATAGKGK
jgi:hypothetical protein